MPGKWLINGKEDRKRGEDKTAGQTDEEGIPSISLSTAEIHDLGFARLSLSFPNFRLLIPSRYRWRGLVLRVILNCKFVVSSAL